MKTLHLILIGIVVFAFLTIMIFRFGSGGEDSWLKDERGVYVKHGKPAETPDYVLQQQEIIELALDLYEQKKQDGMEFASQCLGTINDYAIDIVYVPRTAEDDLAENQCEAYKKGEVSHFIELDKDGNVARIA